MNANRPRHSVLSLFDPLVASHNDFMLTSTRDSSDEDKENAPSNNNTLLLSAFNPTHKQHTYPLVTLPKKRLVDIGEATLDEESILDLLGVEKELLQPDEEQAHLEAPQSRTPFTELTLCETDATPLAWLETHHPHPPPAPPLLNNIVSDVNVALDHDSIGGVDDISVRSSQAPRIVISCSSANNSPEKMSQQACTATTSAASSLAQNDEVPVQRRPNLHLHAPSSDSNRFSVDLQASLQLYMQSEASFDLLNDNISLLDPMESFTTDDDRYDFELEKDKLQDALAKFKRSCKSDASLVDQPRPDLQSEEKQRSREVTPRKGDPCNDLLDSPTFPSNSQQLSQPPSSPLSDSSDKPSKRWSTTSDIPSTSYRRPKELSAIEGKTPSAIPQSKQRRLSSPLTPHHRLPTINPPPAIPALRIIKRTRLPSADAEATENVPATTKGPERPHANKLTRLSTEMVLPETRPLGIEPLPNRQLSTKTTKPPASTGFGPRRMAVSDAPTKSNQPSLPVPSLGPRRMAISSHGSNMPSIKAPSMPSGLKQPTRAESNMSSLPRPIGSSKLPAPGQQGTSKLRRPVAGISKAGLSRRVFSGD